MEELWLVCEGKPDSPDALVLKPIFARVLSAGIVIVPAGGSSPAVAAAFLESQRGGRAAYIIDRDYLRWEQAEESFRDGKRGFIWRRHSIENYLLPPQVIVRSFQRLRARAEQQFAGRLPPWVSALPTEPGQIADGLRECARRRAMEEACRLTVHRLWEDLSPTAGRVQKRVPSLQLDCPPDDLAGWRDALRKETERLREAAALAAASPHLEAPAVARRFDELLANVTAADYITNLDFLIDFHERDLLLEFRQWLEQLGVRLHHKRLVQELVDAVSEVYAGNRSLYGTDDFLDLANGVRTFAGLAVLP